MEWAMSTSGARLPLDPGVLDREPRPLDVVLDVPSLRAKVLSEDCIRSGDAERWLASHRTELRSSHWETCAGAVNHRRGGISEQQERMGL